MENTTQCNKSKMFVELNDKIKKILGMNSAEIKLIKEGNFEKVTIGGKTPQPLMKGEWQLKVIKLQNTVKYIIVINKDIIKFEGGCRYNSFFQKIKEGKGIDILCVERDGNKSRGLIKEDNVKSDKFNLHKFRTSDGGIISLVAEFM